MSGIGTSTTDGELGLRVSLPTDEMVVLSLAEARLLAQELWRLCDARSIPGGGAEQLADAIARALVGDFNVVVQPGAVPALRRALERLAMLLRLTPGLVALRDHAT